MKKILLFVFFLLLVGLGSAGYIVWKNFDAIKPVVTRVPFEPEAIATPSSTPNAAETPTSPTPVLAAVNETNLPLTLPDGFTFSLLAKNIPGARVLALDSQKNLWISQTSQGTLTKLVIKDGKVAEQIKVLDGLNKPHGLAFDPDNPDILYIAEVNRITRYDTALQGPPEYIIGLPSGDRHFTRTLGFGPDKRLYVSIGSTCDVCIEKDERHAKIYTLNKDGTDFKEYARGLRNAVFFRWHPETRELWATEMGRDWLGDNLPPDEINIVKSGANYGWPICYGKNIHDTDFDKNTYVRNPCMEPFETPSFIDLQAHSAPLGLDFFPIQGWPSEYQHDLLVAFHGSWNRSVPTGYKIVRIKLDNEQKYVSTEDFITGFLTNNNQAVGRPADILITPQGSIFISDDKAGAVYQLRFGR